MGKGIAKEFKERYPEMFKEYEKLCKSEIIKPGEPYIYKDLLGTTIINFPTKDHWRSPSRLSYIVDGLAWFCNNYKDYDIKSVAFPPLGCGNGGLKWIDVGPIMYAWLKDLPIDVEIYAPYGTAKQYMTEDFLENAPIIEDMSIEGSCAKSINKKWMLILEVIRQVNGRKYTLHVGRTIFQKICYVLTRCGIDTGLTFVKGVYGPYSAGVKQVIGAFSNANLLLESQMGNMIEMQVNDDFIFDSRQYTSDEMKHVVRTIDLFSRIKNTGQAELISTLMFAFDELLKEMPIVSEEDVLNYVLDWKRRWKDNKENEIVDAIRNLTMLGWIDPNYCDKLHGIDE